MPLTSGTFGRSESAEYPTTFNNLQQSKYILSGADGGFYFWQGWDNRIPQGSLQQPKCEAERPAKALLYIELPLFYIYNLRHEGVVIILKRKPE